MVALMSIHRISAIAGCLVPLALQAIAADQVRTGSGLVEGTTSSDSKIRVFKGIPFAAPPVGALRWKAPQPVASWDGIRKANAFGTRCMQGRIYEDMVFRDSGPSEDCLYLNVWTPAPSAEAHLPVMVWIYGGGFAAGASSEPRQDGENLAKKGVVVVSFNYRLGVFGFFAHEELAKESGHNASGNYGLLDQAAGLRWVQKNIAAFGGDPANVTIFGESAGSFSVSALMASPLSKDLFRRAIGESGAFFGTTLRTKTLAESEQADLKFAERLGAKSLAALRALPAQQLLDAALKEKSIVRFAPNIDGYFLLDSPSEIYGGGRQSHVALLAGWNKDEGSYHQLFHDQPATKQNFEAIVRTGYGNKADDFLKAYSANSDDDVKRAAQALESDRFIGYSTWKWIEMQGATGNSPVFRYQFDQAPPAVKASEAEHGAYHSAEIEFVFGNLASKKLPWRPEDWRVSDLMSTYWSNFAKSGNPNAPGLPSWPAYEKSTGYQVMHISAVPHASPDGQRHRYEVFDEWSRRPTASAHGDSQ
jgi:para-nitrobenzyl esterase